MNDKIIFLRRYKKYTSVRTLNDNWQINDYITEYLNVAVHFDKNTPECYYLIINYKFYYGMKCKKFKLCINKYSNNIKIRFTSNKIQLFDECTNQKFRRYVSKYTKTIKTFYGDYDDYTHLYNFMQDTKYKNLSILDKKRYLLMINHSLTPILKL